MIFTTFADRVRIRPLTLMRRYPQHQIEDDSTLRLTSTPYQMLKLKSLRVESVVNYP